MNVELGTIEGFYGRPWTWAERAATMRSLADVGYRFFLYAPKADPYLRRRWREPHPEGEQRALREFSAACASAGVRFGVGLSPYEVYLGFDRSAREAMEAKLGALDAVPIRDLAILFDDMRGDVDGLAERQAEVVLWIRDRSAADRLIVCPTYYSDDPVLDRVFGRRPERYLSDLAASLPREIEIFWTGEEVCSRELSTAHLRRVGEEIGRRPFLWDNYPVNDGQRMSRYLHLRAFTGRSAGIAPLIAAHGVNPALQPVLTRIPMTTLSDLYQRPESYAYGDAFRRAADGVLGKPLASRIWEDVLLLQDVGLDRLDAEKLAYLRDRYAHEDHPAAREIIGWLAGEYAITDEIVRTQ
jgi:hyaluronoglucosaminidase